jgi:uncharacterized protein (TIGR03435 family)
MTRALIHSLALLLVCGAAYPQTDARLEFEVASIKPSPPANGGMIVSSRGGPGTNDPALFRCQNMNLSSLVTMAYRVEYYQLSAPDWMTATRFDVMAKVPQGATKEQFAVMMQNLLSDRFKLAVRHESRDLQKYDLVIAKNGPKFKEQVPPPAPKGDDTRPPAPGPLTRDKDGYPVLPPGRPAMAIMNDRARLYNPGMTMQQLAGQIAAQIRGPVTDATGLNGKYDINLYWIAGGLSAGAAEPNGVPSTPDPGPTLMQALQDQLGLRLESKKGPVEFIVVEQAQKVPTEN